MQTQTLKPFSAQPRSGQRAVGGTAVIALHVGLVIALLYGLNVIVAPTVKPPIQLTPVVFDKPDDPPPPPPQPRDRLHPEQVFVPPPEPWADESDQADDRGGIQTTYNPPPPTHIATTPAQSIARTHTRPPYPPISVRLNETGIVSLRLVISADGRVEDAVVTRSSGHQRLDDAAVAWVKAQWRYQPAEQNGRPVPSTTSAQMKFELTGR